MINWIKCSEKEGYYLCHKKINNVWSIQCNWFSDKADEFSTFDSKFIMHWKLLPEVHHE